MSKRGQKYGAVSDTASNGRGPSPNPANAWSRPLQSKTRATPAPPPGMNVRKPQNEALSRTTNRGVAVQMSLRERFLHLSMSMVGHKVVVTKTNGAVIEGTFHSFSPFTSLPADKQNKYIIKACKLVKAPLKPEDGDKASNDQSTLIISSDNVASITVKSMPLDTIGANNGNAKPPQQMQKPGDAMFRTDTEISGSKGGRNRDLVAAGSAWTTGPSGGSRADALLGALDDKGARRKGYTPPSTTSGLRGNIGEWDQFKANEELFNVSATFDENLYTTALDKSRMDANKIAEAERIAREIENTTSTNIHVSEERGHVVQGDYDEEDRYSGVLKDNSLRAVLRSKEKPAANNSASNNSSSAGQVPKTEISKATQAPKMNYAAAAAKADGGKKSAPPGFALKSTSQDVVSTPENKPEKDIAKATPDEADKATVKPETEEQKSKEEKPLETKQEKEEEKVDSEKEAKTKDQTELSEPEPEPEPQSKAESQPEPKPESQPEPAADTKESTVEKPSSPAQRESREDTADKKEASKESTIEDTKDSEDDNVEPEKQDNKASESDAPATKVTSKLNANAKEFTLNPTAKSFTPGGNTNSGSSTGAAVSSQDGQFVDPNSGIAMAGATPHMPGPQYMHGTPMGQPGMMPVMNPAFPGVRYPAPYPGMEQHNMSQVPVQQPQHAQMQTSSTAKAASNPSGPGSEDESAQQEGEASMAPAPAPQQQLQQGQMQVSMPYGVPPPGAYYTGGIPMPTRGPGAPHPGYHPQFVGGHQQMPVNPGGAPFRHVYPMQPGGMPPNMQVRGPGTPYYPGPVAPMQYPPGGYVSHGMMDDDSGFRGGRGGRGPGGRGGRRGGRRTGRGGRGYSYHPHGAGRQNMQTPAASNTEEWTPSESAQSSDNRQSGGPADDSAAANTPDDQGPGKQ